MQISRKELLEINNLHPSKVARVSSFMRSLNSNHPLYGSALDVLLSIRGTNLNKYNSTLSNLKKKANKFYKVAERLPYKRTHLSEVELAKALREGYNQAFGTDPTAEALAGGWAQVILESGRPVRLPNNNIGNIKATSGWVSGGNPYFVKKTGEYTPEGKYYIEEETKWRAYPTPAAGAAGYWKLLGGRYKKALDWMAAGDPSSASVALGIRGYYTANIRKYARAVDAYYKEFTDKILPQMPGLKSEAAAPPGEKPEVKDWARNYSKEERTAIISDASAESEQLRDTREIDMLINQLYSAASSETNILVVVNSNDAIEDKIEFARVAANILRKFANAEVSIHSSDNSVELQCSLVGSEEKATNAVNALCECVAFGMEKSFGSKMKPLVFPSLLSKYAALKVNKIVRNRRKFIISRIS